MTTLTIGATLIVATAACVTDLHDRRIPNWLTFGASAAGLAVAYATGGQAGVEHAAGGWATGLFLFLPLFLLGGMGAGDVKLLAALGAWLGPADVFWLAIHASIVGGVLAAAIALRRNYLRTALGNLGHLIRFWGVFGVRPMPALTLDGGKGPRLAYAVPMLLGTVVTLWLH